MTAEQFEKGSELLKIIGSHKKSLSLIKSKESTYLDIKFGKSNHDKLYLSIEHLDDERKELIEKFITLTMEKYESLIDKYQKQFNEL